MLAPHRLGIAAGQLDQAGRQPGMGGLTGQPAEPAARRVPLPAPAMAAGARWPVRVDDHVTDLAGEPVGTAEDPSVGDDPAADPRSQRHHDHVGGADRGTGDPLAVRRARRVVLDVDGPPEPLRDLRPDGQLVATRQVGRGPQDAAAVDEAGRADADRGRLARGRNERIGDCDDGVDDLVRRRRRR